MASCRLWLPTSYLIPRGTPGFTNQALSASGNRIAYAFCAEDTITVNAFGFRLGVITGSSPTYEVALQALNASGAPDGSDISGSTATFNPTSLGWAAGSFNHVSVSGASITRGTTYACLLRYSSGTIDGSNNASFTTVVSNSPPDLLALEYALTDTAGSWVKVGSSGTPVFSYRDSSRTYGCPVKSHTGYNLTTNGHRVCQKLALDSAWGSTFKPRGLMLHNTICPTAGSYKLGIWDGAGTEQASVTLDSDHAGSNSGRQLRGSFTTAPTLNFGTTYYYGVERVSSWNPTANSLDFSDARDMESLPFGSSSCLATWNGSAWTEVPAAIYPLTIMLEDWTVPTSSPAFVRGANTLLRM